MDELSKVLHARAKGLRLCTEEAQKTSEKQALWNGENNDKTTIVPELDKVLAHA